MEQAVKEVNIQYESDKSVSRKHQNKALGPSIHSFICLFLFPADANGRKSFPWMEQ